MDENAKWWRNILNENGLKKGVDANGVPYVIGPRIADMLKQTKPAEQRSPDRVWTLEEILAELPTSSSSEELQ